jgi:hypothetical protein
MQSSTAPANLGTTGDRVRDVSSFSFARRRAGVEAAAALFGLDNLRRKRLAVRSLRKVTTGAP